MQESSQDRRSSRSFRTVRDDAMERELLEAAERCRCTSDHLREAYERLCGMSEARDADPAIEEVRAKMQEIVNKGFPIGRIGELVGTRQAFVDAVLGYRRFIDDLKISDEEKDMLRTAVRGVRDGIIECRVDNRTVGRVAVGGQENAGTEERLSREVADMIRCTIKAVGSDEKYEFWFRERQ